MAASNPAGGEWPGWQRNLWALALIVFTAFVGFSFVNPFLPLYVRDLGVQDPGAIAIWSGVIMGITPGIAAILSPLWGTLADRYGRKAMLMRSLGGFIILIALMGFVTSVEQLLMARVVMGLFAGFSAMAMALASVSCPREKVPVAIGLVQSAQLISVAVGPAAGGYVASQFGIRYAFFVTAGLCALAFITLTFLFQEVDGGRPVTERRRTKRVPVREVFSYPNFALILVLLLIAQFVDRGLSLLVPLKVSTLPDVPAEAAISGIIISVGAVMAAISANGLARLAQRVPIGALLLAGFVVGGVLCMVAGLLQSWIGFLIVRALIGLCLGGSLTLAYSLGGLTIPSEHRGAAFGWLALGVQVGTSISPLATGTLAALSLSGAFFFDGALAWIAAGLLFVTARAAITRRPEMRVVEPAR